MAMNINTNVVSLNAQRNLGLSGSALATAMQRLSSGLRVNSAKDDAAGLAIAERMGAQAKGLQVAARNANDGISLAQTAEGALGKMGDMLQRMRELAVQSSNATNSANDRKALQAEVTQLRSEIDRVAKTTSFNGQKILDGSFAGGVFQVGANAGDNITVGDIANAKANALGKAEYGSSSTGPVLPSAVFNLAEIEAGSLKMRVGASAAIDLGAIPKASSGQERMGQVVAAINGKTADTGVTAFLEGDALSGYTLKLNSASDDAVALEGLNVSQTGFGGSARLGSTVTQAEYDNAVSALTSLASGDAAAFKALYASTIIAAPVFTQAALAAVGTRLPTGDGSAEFTAAFAAFKTTLWSSMENTAASPAFSWNVKADSVPTLQKAADTFKAALDAAVWASGDAKRTAVYSALDTVMAQTSTTTTPVVATLNTNFTDATIAGGAITAQTLSASSTADDLKAAKNAILSAVDTVLSGGAGVSVSEIQVHQGLEQVDISTQSGAWAAIQHIDAAMDEVSSARANLGALQTRFEKSIENIGTMNENISAARGRILDADFASETASLSRTQILQQAGTAMVAQANQLPQQVLSLLQ